MIDVQRVPAIPGEDRFSSATSLLSRAETSKGDRVAEHFDSRDAMLPLRARGSAEEIC